MDIETFKAFTGLRKDIFSRMYAFNHTTVDI